MTLGDNMLKEIKPIDFNSKSIFKALFTFICLFIINTFILVLLQSFIKNTFILYNITYIIMFIPIFLVNKNSLINSFKNIKKDTKGRLKNIIFVVVVILLLEVLFNFALYKITGHYAPNNEMLNKYVEKENIIHSLIYASIMAPLVEGLMFMYPYKEASNKKRAYITYSLVFALFHMTSTSNLIDLLYLIPYLMMSFAFGYGFYKTNNIYVSIVTHSINNIISFMLLFIM